MHLSGNLFKLHTSLYDTQIVSVGGGIASLRFKGKDLMIRHNVDEVAKAHLGKLLIPWPNRVFKGQYEYQGQTYQLWINDFNTPSAIHGLCAFEHWDLVEHTDSYLHLTHYIAAREAYPYFLECHAEYSLSDESGLEVKISVKNLSTKDAPFGIGVHPYFTLNNTKVDEYKIKLPSLKKLTFDENLLVIKKDCDTSLKQYQQSALPLGSTKIDDCFETSSKEDNSSSWQFELKKDNLAIFLKSNSPYVQIYTGEKLGRNGLAIEPMTCPVNAFNQKDKDQYILRANECSLLQFSVSASD